MTSLTAIDENSFFPWEPDQFIIFCKSGDINSSNILQIISFVVSPPLRVNFSIYINNILFELCKVHELLQRNTLLYMSSTFTKIHELQSIIILIALTFYKNVRIMANYVVLVVVNILRVGLLIILSS